MMDLLKDLGQTAMATTERALRLFWDVLSTATGRLREAAGQPPPPVVAPSPAPAARDVTERSGATTAASHREPQVAAKSQAKPKAQVASRSQAKPKARPAKAKKAKKATLKATQGPDERQDQMVRILELLAGAGKSWLSAKEISDATAKSGTAILPGNVRKVIRGRGGEFIETRSREGSRRGALEYRLTEAGRRTSSV